MRIRDFIFRFIAVLLCVAMVAVLIVLLFMNHKRNSERAAELEKRTQDLKKEESNKLEYAADLYDDLVSDLGIRGIVCWGDGEMAGSEKANLPKALKEAAEANLFDEVKGTFSGVIDLESRTAPAVKIINMGVKNEGMREILVRAGVNDLQTGEWTVIPSETEPHDLVLVDDTSWTALHFAEQKNVRFGRARIGDIEGTLTPGEGQYDEDHPKFAFTRDEEGDSTAFGARTRIEIDSAERYIGNIPIFFFEDDSADSVEGFIEDLEELVSRYAVSAAKESSAAANTGSTAETAAQEEPGDGQQYVVICTVEEGSDLDSALVEAFGSHYIRNSSYANEMSEESYRNLAQNVYDKLESQGCFDTVKARTAKAVEDFENLSVKIER